MKQTIYKTSSRIFFMLSFLAINWATWYLIAKDYLCFSGHGGFSAIIAIPLTFWILLLVFVHWVIRREKIDFYIMLAYILLLILMSIVEYNLAPYSLDRWLGQNSIDPYELNGLISCGKAPISSAIEDFISSIFDFTVYIFSPIIKLFV